ncbi:Uu.00g004010.m01.CDS01 [Anthostomella pinea]|uniref:Uu.00g004010.m01.CDS01 n=1 Tax=Anthostomella pinea TaxID=933095 RepID=A0AAI8YIN3_9PEZI|nr:Uu.00g004010.m01.CDS01 [Anthostomella pinea]
MTSVGILSLLALLVGHALADCECGYFITTGPDNTRHVFTDLLESDFVHVDITDDATATYGEYGWAAQDFNMSTEAAHGPYGEAFAAGNVVSNDIADKGVFKGAGAKGPDAGLRLLVQSETRDGMVVNAGVATTDLHYFYGTFRAGIKVTGVEGTCSAFFWYHNDTQEIDMEFLSAQFNKTNNTFPVNLVLQSKQQSQDDDDDARFAASSNTSNFRRVDLPFDPTAAFHEYRFDFLPSSVLFYADGVQLAELEGPGVPSSQTGSLQLSHWSNGNAAWSAGPPETDAVTTVSYVKAYFNSSLEARKGDYEARCPAAVGAVCAVPDYNANFFFEYADGDGVAPNQTGDGGAGGNGAGTGAGTGGVGGGYSWRWSWSSLLVAAALASGVGVFGLY